MSRAAIFRKISAATAALKTKAPRPEYDASITHSTPKLAGSNLLEVFSRNLAEVNGRALLSIAELADFLTKNEQLRGYCDPVLYERIGSPLAAAGLTVETTYERTRYEHTSRRLAALSPWVHVAVLERSTIHRTIGDALAALGDSPHIIWVTGPSKTADVEGILIEGVHGPGEQIALVL